MTMKISFKTIKVFYVDHKITNVMIEDDEEEDVPMDSVKITLDGANPTSIILHRSDVKKLMTGFDFLLSY